ncbi:MAG: hypothetical protein HQL87_15525 [Magnetococcales bacterium]|nr:hypothetical protein [Magnetococcales bacterium]
MGTDLGELMVQADGVTLVAMAAGTAVARITYMVAAMDYALPIPSQLAGQTDFPLLVTAVGWGAGGGLLEVFMQRGDANHPVREVVASLLSNSNLLTCRARTELDLGEGLQRMEMTIVCRPGLEPGQLVEVQDAGYGRSFRGLVVGVRHEMDVQKWVTRLVVWRVGRDDQPPGC